MHLGFYDLRKAFEIQALISGHTNQKFQGSTFSHSRDRDKVKRQGQETRDEYLDLAVPKVGYTLPVVQHHFDRAVGPAEGHMVLLSVVHMLKVNDFFFNLK